MKEIKRLNEIGVMIGPFGGGIAINRMVAKSVALMVGSRASLTVSGLQKFHLRNTLVFSSNGINLLCHLFWIVGSQLREQPRDRKVDRPVVLPRISGYIIIKPTTWPFDPV